MDSYPNAPVRETVQMVVEPPEGPWPKHDLFFSGTIPVPSRETYKMPHTTAKPVKREENLVKFCESLGGVRKPTYLVAKHDGTPGG